MKILLIVADSLRYDYLGCYNPERSTRTLDALAREGCVFESAFSSAPWTVPALASLLTGLWAHRLGIVSWAQGWRPFTPTLFDYFGERGFTRASFVFEPRHPFFRSSRADVVCSSQEPEQVAAWLRAHRRDRYVAFLHYWWTHIPYMERKLERRLWRRLALEMLAPLGAPERSAVELHRERLRRLYAEAVVSFSEKYLPMFVEAAQPDVLVLTADHGESWGERMPGGSAPKRIFDLHGCHLHDEVLRIPLIFYAPELLPRGRRVRGVARSVDVLPTLLEIAGLRGDGQMTGRSLLPAMEHGSVPEDRIAFFARNRSFEEGAPLPSRAADLYEEMGCRSGDCKVLKRIDTGEVRGYNLREDPFEEEPFPLEGGFPSTGLPASLEKEFLRLAEALEEEIQRAVVGRLSEEETALMRKQLEDLGYL